MKKINHKQITIYGSAGILLILLGSLGLSYFTGFRDPLTVSFKRLYPAALIDGRIISINDLELAGIVGKRLGLNENLTKDRFLESEKSYALARRLKLQISPDLAADEMRFYLKGNEAEYRELVEEIFGTEHYFYKYVINPQVIDSQLRIKYFTDFRNSNAAYKEAQSVMDRLLKGEKFEELAKLYSDDKATGQLGGDLGYYESGQVLPELEDQISISKTGDYRKDVITSRLGYHIIFPVEYSIVEGKKMWHAKHILFQGEGYDAWRTTETKSIKVWSIK